MKTVKIQRTIFNPESIKEMGFEAFKTIYSNTLRGDIKEHFETITGEKVKTASKTKKSAD